MKLQFKRINEEVEEEFESESKDFDDGRIEYKDFEIVPSHWEMNVAGETYDVDGAYIVFKSKAKLDNGELMDVVAYCDNEAGMPISFNTVEEAKDYLDRYEGNLDLDVRNTFRGTEFHLVPKNVVRNNEEE